MRHLGIEMIPAYSPEVRGRMERAFRTHQGRLPGELAVYGITTMDAANRYLLKTYLPAFNAEFMQPAAEEGSAFVLWIGTNIEDIVSEQYESTVSSDNCVSFEGKTFQIRPGKYGCHYVTVKVKVHRYVDGSLAIFHGPSNLADYGQHAKLKETRGREGSVVHRSSSCFTNMDNSIC